METLRIVVTCLLAAVLYGVVHDQVTARVCIEYFTIGHPPLIPTESPTLLGLAWGVVATWWVGLPLGLMLAASARLGTRRKLTARQLWPAIARLLISMAGIATVAGICGYVLARSGLVSLTGSLAERVPLMAHERFLGDAWAHTASYASGLVGGIVVTVTTFRTRRLMLESAT